MCTPPGFLPASIYQVQITLNNLLPNSKVVCGAVHLAFVPLIHFSVGGFKTSAVRYEHKTDSKRENKIHYLGINLASDGSSSHTWHQNVSPHKTRVTIYFIRIKTL